MKQKELFFNLFTLAIFLFLLLPSVFKEGLFMDGLIYAVIAKNLAHGDGTFWNLHFSNTFLSPFHEHPPLSFGIQSLFFKLLGDKFYVEKIYSFITALSQAILILLIWQQAANEKIKNLSWLPVILWITIPLCFWSYNNNMLENTMSVFTSAAVLSQLFAIKKSNILYFAVAGGMIFCGFLSKGLPALFPVIFPFIYWLIYRDKSLFHYSVRFSTIVFTLGIISLIIYLIPAASESIGIYFNSQVKESLAGERVVMDRYYIMKKLFMELMPAIGLTIIIYLITKITKTNDRLNFNNQFLLFALIGLSASVPIMISPKQLGFYLVPSLPFFALAVAIAIAEPLHYYIEKIKIKPGHLLLPISIVLLVVIYSISFSGTYIRDEIKITDVKTAGKEIGNGKTISICPVMHEDWSLHGYFARYYNIALDASGRHEFLLSDESCLYDNYKTVLELKNYKLAITESY